MLNVIETVEFSRAVSGESVSRFVLGFEAGWSFLANAAKLSPAERDIIRVLVANPNAVNSQAAIIATLYGNVPAIDRPENKYVEVQICKIRRKLARVLPPGVRVIHTAWGKGYTLTPALADC